MQAIDPLILGLLQVLLCALPAAGLARLLRLSGSPGGRRGAAIVGGLIAGLLIGPGVFGRVSPAWYEAVFVGAVRERAGLRAEVDRQHVEREALEAAGVTDVAVEEQERAVHAPRRAEARRRADHASGEHRARMDIVSGALCAAFVLLALPSACARTGRLWRRTGEHAINSRWLGARRGVVVTLLGASVPGFVAWWLLRDMRLALGIGAAFAMPGLAALPCGLFIACASGMLIAAGAGVVGLWTAPVTMVGVAAFVSLALCVGSERTGRAAKRGENERRWAEGLVLPTITALLVATIDPYAVVGTPVFAWFAVLSVLWSGDGRWLTWKAAGWSWTRGAEMVNAGASAAQLLVGAACSWAGLDAGAVGALVLGCVVIELTTGVRTAMAARMDA